MNLFEKFLLFLQGEMETPIRFGWFHLMWITLALLIIILLYKRKNKHNEIELKIVLGTYGIVALILETLKQLIWSFNYDATLNLVTWDFEWYAFPFQLCTTPIFVTIICLFLKQSNLRKALLSYLAYITILGSISTILLPDSCFVRDILVNIHTMWLHIGSFVVSIYLLISKEIEVNYKNLIYASVVFILFAFIANYLNIVIYNTGILNGETFNMFYISPYFISSLPIFDIIQQNVPYLVFLLIYIIAIILGGTIIFGTSLLIQLIWRIYGKVKKSNI